MKRFNKYIAVFLTLAVLANGVFASQMNVLMIDNTVFDTSSSDESSPPCHQQNSTVQTLIPAEINANNCCDGDCNDCFLGSTITTQESSLTPSVYQALPSIAVVNIQLSAHSSNLYRPPILI
jgi:hypothetical protein